MKIKSNKIKLVVYICCILILVISLGFLRDSVFKSINALLQAWDRDQDYYLPTLFSFLENFEYETLENLKWLLTFFFSLLYLMLTILSIKLFLNNSKYITIAVYTYAGIVIISAFFITIGVLANSFSEKMYEFARYLMGMAQSPIILMILIPAFKLLEKEKNKTV